MKLNYKRTICVGFAFFLICAFWQAYDNTVPLILTNKFGMSQAWSGVIMALDNILALFLLPLFGAISDKHSGKRGRRTPFILIGTIVAAIAFISLSLVDDAQLKNLDGAAAIDDPAALRIVYQKEADRTLKTPDGETFVLEDTFTEDEFAAITSQVTNAEGKTVTNHDYTNYVVPARQAYAHQTTLQHPGALIGFIALLLVVLVAMATFRSPAVALMPDVTIKPLRSKANAVINLMGTGGGILVLAIGMGFATSSVRNSLMSYTAYFSVIAGLIPPDGQRAEVCRRDAGRQHALRHRQRGRRRHTRRLRQARQGRAPLAHFPAAVDRAVVLRLQRRDVEILRLCEQHPAQGL